MTRTILMMREKKKVAGDLRGATGPRRGHTGPIGWPRRGHMGPVGATWNFTGSRKSKCLFFAWPAAGRSRGWSLLHMCGKPTCPPRPAGPRAGLKLVIYSDEDAEQSQAAGLNLRRL